MIVKVTATINTKQYKGGFYEFYFDGFMKKVLPQKVIFYCSLDVVHTIIDPTQFSKLKITWNDNPNEPY